MFANPRWFGRRKWGGWGIYPRTKEGLLYILLLITPVLMLTYSPLPEQTKTSWTLIWTGFVVVDVFSIMLRIKHDKRETKLEAIAERNAGWALVFVIGAGIIYQAYKTSITGINHMDPFLLAALFISWLVKAFSHLYLRNSEI